MTPDALLAPFIAQRPVDLTAFIGTSPWRLQAKATAADLSAMADRLNLTAVCVSHLASVFGFDTRSGNEALYEAVAADARLWPFAVLNPTEPGWTRELTQAIDHRARGIRLVPGYQGYHLRDHGVADCVDAAADAGLPIQLCARLDDARLRHPRYAVRDLASDEIAEFLRAARRSSIVISGLNRAEWSAVTPHLNKGHDLSRVVLDLWFVNGPLAAVQRLCESGGSVRWAYGSCAPLQTAEATAMQLATALISDTDRSALCRDNALHVIEVADE
jgi:predicted TIM-barrel fold metal-dependent hydrolase